MNILKLEQRNYPYEVNGLLCETPASLTEFVIDGVGLSERLSFEEARAWFGYTSFDYFNGKHGKIYPWMLKRILLELLGKSKPMNGFGSSRLVLYRCHCGCDLCGVISCIIKRNEKTIYWNDIRSEIDDPDITINPEDDFLLNGLKISSLCFDVNQYESEINSYLEKMLGFSALLILGMN